jgi:hypothetical protein
MSRLLFISLGTAALAACNPYDPDLGNHPFKCATDGTCPAGYTCEGDDPMTWVCETSQPADIDAPGGQFVCANDSSIEPNNDPNTAFITPLGTSMMTYSLVGLAICPVGDRDHYRFSISQTGQNFEAQVTGVADRPSLSLQVLNAAGAMVASGAPVPGTPQVVRIELVNRLAAGQYTVLVQSPDNTQNNYNLEMDICTSVPPCP